MLYDGVHNKPLLRTPSFTKWHSRKSDRVRTLGMVLQFLFVFLLLLPFSSALRALDETEIAVIPNPHGHASSCASRRLDSLLEPYQLLTRPLATQDDTFRELVYRKVFSVPIPVYRMEQPLRLSASPLEFQLVLVKDLARDANGVIRETPVDPERAVDSWFPGYYWTPLVMACAATAKEGWQHVGWKFTALRENQGLPHFYALMVKMGEEEESTQGILVGGLKAAGWMVNAVMS